MTSKSRTSILCLKCEKRLTGYEELAEHLEENSTHSRLLIDIDIPNFIMLSDVLQHEEHEDFYEELEDGDEWKV